ncbi:hypothetical protein QA635_19280 [Bradyrhizobium brasilense]|uniref:hypothetical protein n=1 Tax=Bradyrhizobium brasilense TaxID=1419277 RepID=UPI0024B1EE6E|nr:hypothetical protein [Bradyrhizobium australafricanum]WFU36438.1 hypothetical protein QA635_19280 [Bradyrhizobium australafricanum]
MVASIMTLPHYCLGEVVPVNCFRPVSSADENGFVAGRCNNRLPDRARALLGSLGIDTVTPT